MINEKINRKILAVWQKHFGSNNTDVYAPIFYDDFKQGGILFVGMNPSLNFPVFKAAARAAGYEKLDPATFLRWNNISSNPDSIDINVKIGRSVFVTYKGYFKKMDEISDAAGLAYQHADLFVYRQTSQKDFLSLIYDKRTLNEFGRDQLDIFHDAVASIRPAIIVVPNAFVSGILRKEWKDNISSFDTARGFHWLTLDGRRIPIFFSSMLSGQRALDTGSYERLRWHIAQAATKQPSRLSARVELF